MSEQTIRRDIERGIIRARRTLGGHRKIPEAQIPLYLEFMKTGNKRNATDLEAIRIVMEKVLERNA